MRLLLGPLSDRACVPWREFDVDAAVRLEGDSSAGPQRGIRRVLLLVEGYRVRLEEACKCKDGLLNGKALANAPAQMTAQQPTSGTTPAT